MSLTAATTPRLRRRSFHAYLIQTLGAHACSDPIPSSLT